MDPKANLEEQRILANAILARVDAVADESERLDDDAVRLAELVVSLDRWRIMGGFDPYVARA